MEQGIGETSDKTEIATETVFYAKEELMAHSQELFACTSEVLIGALHGKMETAFTIEETKQFIQNFLQRKVQD